jgi:hypothetical protein
LSSVRYRHASSGDHSVPVVIGLPYGNQPAAETGHGPGAAGTGGE